LPRHTYLPFHFEPSVAPHVSPARPGPARPGTARRAGPPRPPAFV